MLWASQLIWRWMVERTIDELGSVWKESVVVEFEALSEHFPLVLTKPTKRTRLISRPISESGVCLIRCFSQHSWDIIAVITAFLSVLFNDSRSCWVYLASVMSELMSDRGQCWNDTARGENRSAWRKVYCSVICTLHIPHGLAWNRTHVSLLRGRYLTDQDTARYYYYYYYYYYYCC